MSTLAGFVDAIGFIRLGGLFVSFMSGNSTRLAVSVALGEPLTAGALIGAFVLGVVLGAVVGRAAPAHRAPSAVLATVAVLLAAAAGLAQWGTGAASLGLMAMAMGAENSVFALGGEVQIGLTYMTGALVKFGQHLAAALLGGNRLDWAPHLLLWFGLVVGAVAGARAYTAWGLHSLWVAAAIAALLAVAVSRMGALVPAAIRPGDPG